MLIRWVLLCARGGEGKKHALLRFSLSLSVVTLVLYILFSFSWNEQRLSSSRVIFISAWKILLQPYLIIELFRYSSIWIIGTTLYILLVFHITSNRIIYSLCLVYNHDDDNAISSLLFDYSRATFFVLLPKLYLILANVLIPSCPVTVACKLN